MGPSPSVFRQLHALRGQCQNRGRSYREEVPRLRNTIRKSSLVLIVSELSTLVSSSSQFWHSNTGLSGTPLALQQHTSGRNICKPYSAGVFLFMTETCHLRTKKRHPRNSVELRSRSAGQNHSAHVVVEGQGDVAKARPSSECL